MPIFEYRCQKCDTKYEVLHKSTLNQQEVSCPNCNSTESKKLFSAFSASVESSSGYSSGCENGSCGIPASSSASGCASGLCGLN